MAKLGERVLTRLRRRDPDALRAIVDAHARPLYRAARGMGFTIEEAEDLAQDVFVTFIESLERFEGRAQREVFQLRQVEELSAEADLVQVYMV